MEGENVRGLNNEFDQDKRMSCILQVVNEETKKQHNNLTRKRGGLRTRLTYHSQRTCNYERNSYLFILLP